MIDPLAEIFYVSFHQLVSSKGPWVADRCPQTKISALGLGGPLHGTFGLMQYCVADLKARSPWKARALFQGLELFNPPDVWFAPKSRCS